MTISIPCDCGRSLQAKEELAGRKVRCPSCKTILVVPQPKPREDAEEAALQLLLDDSEPTTASPRSEPPAAYGLAEDRIQQADPAPKFNRPPASVTKEKPRRARSVAHDTDSEGSGFSIAVNPEITTGLLMMLGAVLWFVLGLAGGRIFFYPPILFIMGIGAIIRGFTGRD